MSETENKKNEDSKLAARPKSRPLSIFGFDRMERMMDRFRRRIDDIFLGGFDDEFGLADFRTPVTNVTTTDDAYIYHVELPGLSKDNIDIEIDENFMTIKGEKEIEEEEEGYYHKETSNFYKRVSLPSDGNTIKISRRLLKMDCLT